MHYIEEDPTDPDIKWFKKNPGRLYRIRRGTKEELPQKDRSEGCNYYVLLYQVVPGMVMGLRVCVAFDLEDQNDFDLTKDSDLQQLGFWVAEEDYLDGQDEAHEYAMNAGLVTNEIGLRQLP